MGDIVDCRRATAVVHGADQSALVDVGVLGKGTRGSQRSCSQRGKPVSLLSSV